MSEALVDVPGASIRSAGAALAPYSQMVRDLALYGLSSAVALALDWATLAGLVRHGVPTAAAATAGFALGMIVTFGASVGFIFADRRQGSRLRELTVFVLIGVAGLGLNVLLICLLGSLLGLSASIAKAPTAVVVFLFNFTARRAMLFAAPKP